MIRTADSVKRFNSARDRFFRPAVINFFAREFPRFFGPVLRARIADELIDLFERNTPDKKRLLPGQAVWNALDKDTRGDSPNRRYVTVVLSMVTEADVNELVQGTSRVEVTKHALARMTREAYEQGGLLSMRDLALLTLTDHSRISQLRMAYEKEQDCLLPHTGLLHDMGSCISHKKIIVQKVMLEKKDPAAVAKECNHSQKAVDRYLKDYHRVKTAYQHKQDVDYVHLVTGIAKHVVKQYVELIT